MLTNRLAWRARQDAIAAHNPAPPVPCADHTADLVRVLRAMPVGSATVWVRNSRGEAWAVTRINHGAWIASRQGRMLLHGGAAYVAEAMEA
jgi:hypothetical protein